MTVAEVPNLALEVDANLSNFINQSASQYGTLVRVSDRRSIPMAEHLENKLLTAG